MIVIRKYNTSAKNSANFGLNLKSLPLDQKLKIAGGIAAVGGTAIGAGTVGTLMFIRRRRTKKGKVIIEQVRR